LIAFLHYIKVLMKIRLALLALDILRFRVPSPVQAAKKTWGTSFLIGGELKERARKPRRHSQSTNLRSLHISTVHWALQNYSCRWNNLPRILTVFLRKKAPPVDVPIFDKCPAEFQCASCVSTLTLLWTLLLFGLGKPQLCAKLRNHKLHTM
jgi:hypothetical protein